MLKDFFWMSGQIIFQAIYCSSLCFRDQFDVLEGKFWTRYPFAWLFFGSKNNRFGRFGTLLAHIGGFLSMSFQINVEAIYSPPSCFCVQFTLQENKFFDRYPFLWLFSWFKKWHLRQSWHISRTHWRISSNLVDKPLYE